MTGERDRQARLDALGRWLLVLGLASALVIYFVAAPDAAGPLGEQAGSKQYRHDLEVYGGKANILQDQFRSWFAGLWHGRSLAGTVAVLSLLAFGTIRLVAGPRPIDPGVRRDRARLRLVDPGGTTSGERRKRSPP